MENKESFKNRIAPFFGTYDLLDLQLAYYLSKYGHRGNLRQELNEEGKPLRYFEHVRRVSLILMDEMQIMDRNMIISALLHDSIEDCPDLPPELLEHCFGGEVTTIVKLLSKIPKENYCSRLLIANNWKALAIKACDRLDNLRSLDSTKLEFQQKQIFETKDKYYPLFKKLLEICPAEYKNNVSPIIKEIKSIVDSYIKIFNKLEKEKCTGCKGSGYSKWVNEEIYSLCDLCNGKGKGGTL